MPSTAGATKARKSEGVIHDGTARTPSITPSESWSEIDISETLASSSSGEGMLEPSRKTCTVPSGKLVEPDLLRACGTKVASTGPVMISDTVFKGDSGQIVDGASHLCHVPLPFFHRVGLKTSLQSQSSQPLLVRSYNLYSRSVEKVYLCDG